MAAIERFFRNQHQTQDFAATTATPLTLLPMSGDGSNRRFFRVVDQSGATVVAVLPASDTEKSRAEFQATRDIGYHLKAAGNPVPEILSSDPLTGLVLFEDFGDCHLFDLLCQNRAAGIARYPAIIKALVKLQVSGGHNFKPAWCHDTPCYDRGVMVDREAGYFFDAFWKKVLSGPEVPGLAAEFEILAAKVLKQPQRLFLHRDFQSKNIMIRNGTIGIIDFQGGRLGPPAYDIASLLIDPYAGLCRAEQEQFLALYLREAASCPELDLGQIEQSFPYLAVQRSLQIIGAFAFLSYQAKKPFFQKFIIPAVELLKEKLAAPRFEKFLLLKKTVDTALTQYTRLNR